jgi:hypothetical protein
MGVTEGWDASMVNLNILVENRIIRMGEGREN